MKIDIEALAKDSGALIRHWRFSEPVLDEYAFSQDELEAFTRLVVERCAQECEQVKAIYADTATNICDTEHGRNLNTFGAAGAKDCASAIRNLLED